MTPPRHGQNPLHALMVQWPKSWVGIGDDETVGRDLTELMRHFFIHLQQQDFSAKTLRRHLDNLWFIGGEIIRGLHEDPALRKKSARKLLLDAIHDGEAPWGGDVNEEQQRSLDATARKLYRFLLGPTP